MRAAQQRGELRDTQSGPVVELLVAMLCGVWVYVGFLGTEHGRAITSTIRQLLTGRLPTLTEVPTVSAGVAGATRTGASSTTTAATSVLVRVDGDTWIGQ